MTRVLTLIAALVPALLGASCARAQPAPPERFAVLVGVDAYAEPKLKADRVDPLKAPGNDVALVRDLLVGSYHFPNDAEHVVKLVGPEATRAAILAALKSLVVQATAHPGAIVVFYFSGHGSQTPDLNGDEPDGFDETLVAYDSRAGSRDITDDEVFAWLQELRRHTQHITVILDSCHSESGARAIGTRRSRELSPQAAPKVPAANDLDTLAGAGDFLPPGRDYVMLAGARAYESSYEDEIATASGKRPYGYFTYYLVQALKAHPSLTYRSLIDEVTTALSKLSPDQHPQAEGAIEAHVFEASGEDDPFLPIVGALQGARFRFAGGRIMGLQPGALLAVYAPTARRLVGETDKLANARIVELGADTSLAELTDLPKAPLDANAKVIVTTPFFGLEGQRVWLENLPGQSTTAADHALLERVRAQLAVNRLVTPIKTADWDLAVRRGCTAGGRLYPATAARRPATCAPAYYLTGPNLDVALLGAWRSSGADIAQQLVELIETRAKQENIRGLANATGRLEGQVRLVLAHAMLAPGADPPFVTGADFPTATSTTLPLGEIYMIKAYNDTDVDLWIAMALLGADGSVSLVGPTSQGELVPAGSSAWLTRVPFEAKTPIGRKTYKAIATTHGGTNFKVIEQPAGARAGVASALEWLLTTRPDTATRGADAGQGLGSDDWTTARLDLDVHARPSAPVTPPNPKKDAP